MKCQIMEHLNAVVATEGVYETVDDKTDTEMIMIANEAYGTTATTTI
jgi:hypothetical protein